MNFYQPEKGHLQCLVCDYKQLHVKVYQDHNGELVILSILCPRCENSWQDERKKDIRLKKDKL